METLAAYKPLYSASAYRMADILNDALVNYPWCVHRWMAFMLATGESDGVVYDTRKECVTHQVNEQYCCYVQIIPMGVTAQMCQGMLNFYRAAYDSGRRIVDPEQPDYILPTPNEDFSSQVARLKQKKR